MKSKELRKTEADKLIAVIKNNLPTYFFDTEAMIYHEDRDELNIHFGFSYYEMVKYIVDQFYEHLDPEIRNEIAVIVSSCITPTDIDYKFSTNIQYIIEISDYEVDDLEHLLKNIEVRA